jgi:hypothetical protein
MTHEEYVEYLAERANLSDDVPEAIECAAAMLLIEEDGE